MRNRMLVSAFLAMLVPAAFAERSNVFFIHGANVTLEGEQIWAEQMFKRLWQAGADAVVDVSVFATNTVFNPFPASITNAVATRLETDYHLAQGIPALSPPTGRTDLRSFDIQSFDMNTAEFMANTWPRSSGDLGNRFLHSDVKDVAYFFVHPVFRKIVEVGGFGR